MFGAPILLPALVTEATSLGAAIAGGVGVGLYPDFSIAQRFVCAAESERPDPAAQARYAELLPLFGDAYRALEPIFTRFRYVIHEYNSRCRGTRGCLNHDRLACDQQLRLC